MDEFANKITRDLSAKNKWIFINTREPESADAVVSLLDEHGYAVLDTTSLMKQEAKDKARAEVITVLKGIARTTKLAIIGPFGPEDLQEPDIGVVVNAEPFDARTPNEGIIEYVYAPSHASGSIPFWARQGVQAGAGFADPTANQSAAPVPGGQPAVGATPPGSTAGQAPPTPGPTGAQD